jgi:hypothetical protein
LQSIILGREKYLYLAITAGWLVFAYQSYQWMGVAFLVSGAVMWALLHYSRLLQVFKKAAGRPIGYVASAVMLNAKLKTGLSLLHVIALTKSLGKVVVAGAQDGVFEKKGVIREVFIWSDSSESSVRCTFDNGKLTSFELIRPLQAED